MRDRLAPCTIALALSFAAAGCGAPAGGGQPPADPTPAPLTPSAAPRLAPPATHGHAHRHQGHHGGPLVHRFERAEDWAPELDDPARDAWQHPAEVIAIMAIRPGMTVVDLGAGTGYFLRHLSAAAGSSGAVIALDVEADMVRYMTERAAREGLTNVTARLVPFDDPGLAPETADRILIVDTWHHIADRGRYAAKLAAALRPGGAVLVVDFTHDTTRGPPKEHRLRPEEVAAELRAGGLLTETAREELPDQYIVVGRRARP
jgi:SAM-dependent methyltransferase